MSLARPDRSPITLRFLDRELESAFLADHAAESIPFFRMGLLVSIFLWPLAAALIPHWTTTNVTPAQWIICAGVVPFLVLALIATRWTRSSRAQQALSAVANFIPGLTTITLGYVMGSDRFLLPVLILCMVYAFAVMRLLIPTAVGATLTYVVGFLAYTMAVGQFSVFDAFVLWSAWSSLLMATYLNERTIRGAYYQRLVVAEQRAMLATEREKSERLLLNVLPASIAARLREDEHSTLAEHFEEATVLFADIVGFTVFSSTRPAREVVMLLDRLFTGFDLLAEKHGLEKIKTIGDAYMAVSGVPIRRKDHAQLATAMALEMIAFTAELARTDAVPLSVRIGINSGPVIAGVIGKKKFMYDLWGDTVNTASRMESHGLPGKVHLSEAAWRMVEPRFHADERGEIDVKGKGVMRTWFVTSAGPS